MRQFLETGFEYRAIFFTMKGHLKLVKWLLIVVKIQESFRFTALLFKEYDMRKMSASIRETPTNVADIFQFSIHAQLIWTITTNSSIHFLF